MTNESRFIDEIDKYVVLKLVLSNFRDSKHPFPLDAFFLSEEIPVEIRQKEKQLLHFYFKHWKIPYYRKLPGWRNDSAIYLLWQNQLVCGVYLCDKNEFRNELGWGQLHYAYIDPKFKGKKLYSLVFKEAVKRAQSWGLIGIYLNSDRHFLPKVYERWGATRWKEIPKLIIYPKYKILRQGNWLVYKIHDRMLAKLLIKYANGILVDIGCGEKPYRCLTLGMVTAHIGLDHPGTFHNKSQIDLFATAYDTSLAGSSVDTVLCTAVLEHLERPQDALVEIYRIMKPGGHIILTAPLFWHLHEEPRDFYRFTYYGLEYLFNNAGFNIVEINPLSGFLVTFSQEMIYFMKYIGNGLFRYITIPIQIITQVLAFGLDRWDKSYRFTWAYLVVAKKNGTHSC